MLTASNVAQALPPEEASRKEPFRLSVKVEDARPQLTRDPSDMQISLLGGGADKPAAAAQNAPPAMAPQAPPARMAVRPDVPAPTPPGGIADDAPNSFLKEYDVDWSSYITVLADRWYANLRTMEYQCGMQFLTLRPALIQFTCYSNGQLGNIVLKQSSGVLIYDRMQMIALSRVTPLPPFPAGTRRTTVTLVQGWESHAKRPGEQEFQMGNFGRGFPTERVRQWVHKE